MRPRGTFALRFAPRVLLVFAVLTAVEALIATVWSQHRWLRGFVGDVLAVAWLYLLCKTFVRGPVTVLAAGAFGAGCLLELAQYLAKVQGWHIRQPVLRVLVGSVPDWWDVLAYAVGLVLVLGAEAVCGRLGSNRQTGDRR